jgi:hypothetical protein
MELDELKEQAQKMRVTDRQVLNPHVSAQAMTGFISAMKAEDQRDRKRIRRMMLFTAAAGVFYVLLFTLTWIAPPDESPEWHRLVLSAFGLLFLSAALVGRMKSNELSGVDYAQPIGAFLRSVERRYKIVNMRDAGLGVIFTAAFSVTGALGWLNAKDRYFPSMDQGTALIVYGGVLAAVLVVGLILGVNEWKKRKAPLLRQIREMKADLETPGSETASEEPS